MLDHLSDRKYVWGIDPSYTGTGFAAINIETGSVILEKFSSVDGESLVDRTNSINNYLVNAYKKYKPAVILMESAFYNRRTAASMILTKLNHAIELALYNEGGALYRGVSPTAAKKFITGDKSASKGMMADCIFAKYGYMITEHNMNDAFAFATIAKVLYLTFKNFDFHGYDCNSKDSMKLFVENLCEFVVCQDRSTKTIEKIVESDKTYYQMIINLLTSEVAGMFSLTCLCKDHKKIKVIRKQPEVMIYNGNMNNTENLRDQMDFIERDIDTGMDAVIVNMDDREVCTFDEKVVKMKKKMEAAYSAIAYK
jgi:Holliday junction resolvasome RuvABC endonuclease subunit